MSLNTFKESTGKQYSFGNKFNLPIEIYKGVIRAAEEVAQDAIAPISPTGVVLTDGATINTDASLGSDFYVTLAGNRTFAAPTNPTDWKVIRFYITQDATGSRTGTWNAIFRFSTGLPSPTLTTTANFSDYIAFMYNPTYSTWDCLSIVKGFDSTPI